MKVWFMNEMTFKRLSKEKTKNNSILLFENGKNGLFVFLCGESRPLRIEKKAIMKWNGIIGWWTMKQSHQPAPSTNSFSSFNPIQIKDIWFDLVELKENWVVDSALAPFHPIFSLNLNSWRWMNSNGEKLSSIKFKK